MRKAKQVAAERGMSLKALVEEALRAALEQPLTARRAKPFKMATFKGNGLQPGLTWGDWESWRGISYDGRGG